VGINRFNWLEWKKLITSGEWSETEIISAWRAAPTNSATTLRRTLMSNHKAEADDFTPPSDDLVRMIVGGEK
jgi:hypothetical protein